MPRETQASTRQISFFESKRQWYESLARAPWRIWCSNTPPDEEGAYLDGQADSGHPDPRGECGRVREPIEAGSLFSIHLIPDRETRDSCGCRDQARYADGYEYPLCFIHETLTEDSAVGVARVLQEIRDRHELDMLDAAAFLTHVVMWFSDWRRAEAGSPSVFDLVPIRPNSDLPLGLADDDELAIRFETPISEIAPVLRFWDALGRRLSAYLAVQPSATGAQATFTLLPPRYLSHEGTRHDRTVHREVQDSIALEDDGSVTITYSRNTFLKRGDRWVLVFDDRVGFGNDSDGMLYIAKLLYEPGVAIHVADLKEVPRSSAVGETADVASIQEIEADIAAYRFEIESTVGPEREVLIKELEALIKRRDALVGLGGRPRRLKDPMESVRISVQRACHRAVDHIRQIHPPLANHLSQHLQYGFNCMYEPADPPIYWAT